MKFEPQIYRIANGNVYSEFGDCISNLDDADAYAPGWWRLQQHECCGIACPAITEYRGDFSRDFDAYGPYDSAAQAHKA